MNASDTRTAATATGRATRMSGRRRREAAGIRKTRGRASGGRLQVRWGNYAVSYSTFTGYESAGGRQNRI